MEIWLIALIVVILVMAEVLRTLSKRGRAAGWTGKRPSRGAFFHPGRGAYTSDIRVNYALAPRAPEIMAAALFDLLSRKLNYEQMLVVSELIASPSLTGQYIERLASRSSTVDLAEQLAFLSNSMEANGFTPEERLKVSEALVKKTNREYKLLKIHKNMDKLF
ncbi:MAG TPA: hypothetical protein VM123_06410 [archaeon]|nr:hypothetical protein [archaeon]